MSNPMSDSDSYAGASIEFRAKLPDDISPAEIAALLNAITALDSSAVAAVRDSPEAQLLGYPVRSVQPSTVRRVRYGSDFQVVLDVVAQVGIPTSMIVGAWIGIAKGFDFIANARLKDEERKGKREDRLARRTERARAQETVARRYYWSLGPFGVEFVKPSDAVKDAELSAEETADAALEARREEALNTLVPRELREAAEGSLPSGLNTEEVVIALGELSDSGVTIQITPAQPVARP